MEEIQDGGRHNLLKPAAAPAFTERAKCSLGQEGTKHWELDTSSTADS